METQSYSYWTPSSGIRTLKITPNTGDLWEPVTETVTETVKESAGPYSTVIIPPLFKTVTITTDRFDSSDAYSRPQETSATPTYGDSATFDDSSSSSINEPGMHSIDIGAIIGGVLGGLTIVGTIFIAMYWIRRKHPDSNKSEKSAGANDEGRGTTSDDVEETPYELPGTQTAPELADTAVLHSRLPTS